MENLLFADVNIRELVENVHIGPQAEVLEEIQRFNTRYLTNSFYRQLQDHKRLSVTKKFYWKPGAYDTIKAIINNLQRFDQKSNSLERVVERVRTDSTWRMRNLWNEVRSIEGMLKSFRNNGVEMQDNTDNAVEAWEMIKNHIGNQYTEGSQTFSPYITAKYGGNQITDYELEIQYEYHNPVIEYTHSGESNALAEIEIPMEVKLKVRFSLSKWINILIKAKFNFDNINIDFIRSSQSYNSNYNYSIGASIVGDYYCYHPYISRHSNYGNRNNNDSQFMYVCVGNLDREIRACIRNFDFISLKVFFDKLMLHYDTNTGPLNNIKQSYHGFPTFLKDTEEYNSIVGTGNMDENGYGCSYSNHIEDMDKIWITEESYCALYCTIKKKCNAYITNTRTLSKEEIEKRFLEQATLNAARRI